MTACVTSSPRYDSAVSFILPRMKAEICEGLYFSPRASTQASPLPPSMTLNGMFFLSLARSLSSTRRPIRRDWLPSMMATQLLVVPRSIPMTLDMLFDPFSIKAMFRTPDPFWHRASDLGAGHGRPWVRALRVYRQAELALQAARRGGIRDSVLNSREELSERGAT